MDYLMFSLLFTGLHLFSYVAAGSISLQLSGDLYRGENRLLDFMRDMSENSDSIHVKRYFMLVQIPRGLIMSVVLYPLLGVLGDLGVLQRFLFFAGIMFFYTDFACSVPFPHNIEGFVYIKEKYLRKDLVWKLYIETAVYSILFGILASRILLQ